MSLSPSPSLIQMLGTLGSCEQTEQGWKVVAPGQASLEIWGWQLEDAQEGINLLLVSYMTAEPRASGLGSAAVAVLARYAQAQGKTLIFHKVANDRFAARLTRLLPGISAQNPVTNTMTWDPADSAGLLASAPVVL